MNSEEVKIEKLKLSDIEEFCRFCMEVTPPPFNETTTIVDIIKGPITRLAEGKEFIMVLRDSKGKIVGYAFLRKHPTQRNTYGFGIGLHKDYRGKGLGGRLMHKLFDTAREELGVERIELSVNAENIPAVKLYEKFGFKKLRTKTLPDGKQIFYMVKSYIDEPADEHRIITQIRERRDKLFAEYRKVSRNRFDEKGNWVYPGRKMGRLRENYWHSLAFLASPNEEDHKFIMPILEKEVHYFCAFTPFACLQILCKHDDKLTDLARKRLADYVAENLPKSCTIDFQFHGYNDNMPCMKTFVLLAGGELLNEDKYIDEGLANLCQLKALLRRRGFLSEFNSPTYSAVSLLAIAEIVNHIKNPDAKELARICEERIFAEIVFHWHKETSGLVGPFSRAYTVDSVGHVSMVNTLMWLILGDEVYINPIKYLLSDEVEKVVLHHKRNLPSNQVNSIWVASVDYHPHPELIDYLKHTGYPRVVVGTTEKGESHPGRTEVNPKDGTYRFIREGNFVHRPRGFPTTSYLTNRWAMGTALGYFGNNAQTEFFHLRYTLADKPKGIEDIRTIYARYIINEKSIYADVDEAGEKGRWPDDLLRNQGHGFAFQKEGTAMVCYSPLPYSEKGEISALKLSLLMLCKHNEPEKIEIAEDKIIIKDAYLWILFRPLVNSQLDNLEGAGTIELHRDGDWLRIDIFNYKGKAKVFTKQELSQIANGFIIEISEKPFEKSIIQAKIIDRYYMDQRRIYYSRDGIKLACSYDPVSMGIRYATIDGKNVPYTLLDVNDFGVGKLPLIGSDRTLDTLSNFDWAKIIESRNFPY